MSAHLLPCLGCGRHVRANESACPFCGATVDASVTVPGVPERRLNRAATFAFGAALAAATVASGCGESHSTDAGGGPEDAGEVEEDAGYDAGSVAPPYGIPADGGPVAAYGGPPVDSGFAPLYGGAPGD